MNPLTIGLQAVGLGLQIFGGMGAADNAKKQSQLSMQAAGINRSIAGDEQSINEQKRIQMEMSARRLQTETFRNAQRARAQAQAAAVNQGASLGSGLPGGLAQVTDDTLFTSQGISNNLAVGENIFNYNNVISGKKMQLADVQGQISSLQGDQASNQALMSLGGGLVSNAGTLGNIGKFASSKLPGTGFAGPYV